MSSKSSSPNSGGNEEPPAPPALPPLQTSPAPNPQSKSLPEASSTSINAASFPTAAEGDWRQKLQLEQLMMGGMMPAAAAVNTNFTTTADMAKYFGNNTAAAGSSIADMMMNQNNNAVAAAGSATLTGSDRDQMRAELRRMQEENEELIRLLSSRQQQQQLAFGGSGGGGGGNGNSVNAMMLQQQQQAVGDVAAATLNSEGSQAYSVGAAAAGGTNNNMNSAALMGGMMGMNRSTNMMMPYTSMLGGLGNLNGMMPFSSTTLAGASNTSNNNNNIEVPKSMIDTNEDPNWETRYHELLQFKSEFGHTRVPARYKNNPKLGRWVMTQRRQFTVLMQGFPSALSTERMTKLNEIGFVWALRADPVTMWNRKFLELKAYKRLFGNCLVPQRYQPNPKLGTWVHTQRRQYKLMLEGKKNSMNKEKITALDSIGFFWMARQGGGEGEEGAVVDSSHLLQQGEEKIEGYGQDVDEDVDDSAGD